MVRLEEWPAALIQIIDRLLAPDGCPWDRKQGVEALAKMLHEEVCELLDTLHEVDDEALSDELGDVCIGTFFLAKAAEREGRFLWQKPFQKACEKLTRRHPHIFGEAAKLTVQEVEDQWAEIKKKEKSHCNRKDVFDGISPSLPALSMVQKLVHVDPARLVVEAESEEELLGQKMAQLVVEAEERGVAAEMALRAFFNRCRKVARGC